MDRKIGKNILSCFLLTSFFYIYSQTTIELKLFDVNEEPLSKAAVGVPFIVDVIITNQSSFDASDIQIAGIDQFVLQGRNHVSTVNTIVNGVSSYKKIVRYTLIGKKEGFFTLGPVSVQLNGKKVQSESIKFSVAKEVEVKKDDPLIEINLDPEVAYVGQKIACSIRFFPGSSTQLQGISEPRFPESLQATPLEGPFSGQITRAGQKRDYIEWRCSLTASQAGTFDIPSVAAMYKVPLPQSRTRNIFDLDAFSLFNKPFQEKQIFSSAQTVRVDALPESPYKNSVFGVGRFIYESFSLHPAIAKEGEGIVARLVVRGNGYIKRFPLLVLPEGLKYYESKKYIDETRKGDTEQYFVFEYIIQGIKKGKYTIKDHEIFFFNIESKKYIPLHTEAVSVEIVPLVSVPQEEPKQEKKDEIVEQKSFTVKKEQQSSNQVCEIEKPVSGYKAIPWQTFINIVMFICLMGLIILLWRWYKAYAQNNAPYIRSKKAFSMARKKIKELQDQKNIMVLYDVFVTLFADRYQISIEEVDTIFMKKMIEKSDAGRAVVSDWQNFIETLLRFKFGNVLYAHDSNKIIEDAFIWVKKLERILSV